MRLLLFWTGGRGYAVEAERLQRILSGGESEAVVPVLGEFVLPGSTAPEAGIFLQVEGGTVRVPADRIGQIEEYEPTSCLPVPGFLFPGGLRPVRAVACRGGEAYIVLDPEGLRRLILNSDGGGPPADGQSPSQAPSGSSPAVRVPPRGPWILVRISGRSLAFALHRTRLVQPAAGIIPIPYAKPFVSGIMPAEGIAVPIFDLRRIPGLVEWGPEGECPLILILDCEETRVGVLVETAEVVRSGEGGPTPAATLFPDERWLLQALHVG